MSYPVPASTAEELSTIRFLQSTKLFGALDADSLLSLARVCQHRRYGKGQYLWYQGDDGDRLLIVRSGRVKILLTSPGGEEVMLAVVGPGDSIGELAVVDGSPRSASAVTIEPTSVVALGRSAALEIMALKPMVLRAFLSYLGELVRKVTEQTGDLVFLDLGGRLSKLLLRLAGDDGAGADELTVNLGLSQSDLAAMVGGSRPAVNRALQLLAGRGLLSIQGQTIVLHDPSALRRRAGI